MVSDNCRALARIVLPSGDGHALAAKLVNELVEAAAARWATLPAQSGVSPQRVYREAATINAANAPACGDPTQPTPLA